MNVNSAMKFFPPSPQHGRGHGADPHRQSQLAALEASTQCLILTVSGEPMAS